MTKQQFINLTGEDPIDVLGQDWENYIEDYFEEGRFGDYILRWERQIKTPYSKLTEKEKEADREQVRRYLPIISNLLLQEKAKCTADFEKRLEEYRNSPNVWKNVGISKWRNWGVANGYFQFFNIVDKQELKEKIVALKTQSDDENPFGDPMAEFDKVHNQAIEEVLKLLI